jgi:hypothetical protein
MESLKKASFRRRSLKIGDWNHGLNKGMEKTKAL